jgi:hypothetical protein
MEAQLRLLEALKSICDETGEYKDTKIDQTNQDEPHLELTTKCGTVQKLVAVAADDGELGIIIPTKHGPNDRHKFNPHIHHAFQKAFPREDPMF